MSREALVLLVCCCDFRDRAERLIPSKSLRNAVIWAFPGLFCILRMCAPRRAAAVVRPRGREKSADRRRRILISRLLIIRASVPRWKSPFPAYFKGFPAVSPLIPPYPAFLKYPVSPQLAHRRRLDGMGLHHHRAGWGKGGGDLKGAAPLDGYLCAGHCRSGGCAVRADVRAGHRRGKVFSELKSGPAVEFSTWQGRFG